MRYHTVLADRVQASKLQFIALDCLFAGLVAVKLGSYRAIIAGWQTGSARNSSVHNSVAVLRYLITDIEVKRKCSACGWKRRTSNFCFYDVGAMTKNTAILIPTNRHSSFVGEFDDEVGERDN